MIAIQLTNEQLSTLRELVLQGINAPAMQGTTPEQLVESRKKLLALYDKIEAISHDEEK